jgi:hypothetical protein
VKLFPYETGDAVLCKAGGALPDHVVIVPLMDPALVIDPYTSTVITLDVSAGLQSLLMILKSFFWVMDVVTFPEPAPVAKVVHVLRPAGLDCQLKLEPTPPELDNVMFDPGQTIDKGAEMVAAVFTVTLIV